MVDHLELKVDQLQCFHGHLEGQHRFLVVSLERALNLELVDVLLLNVLGVRLHLAISLRELSGCRRQSSDSYALEQSVAGAVCIDTCKLHLLFISAKEDLHAVGPSKVWDRELELLHEQFHHFVHPLVNDQRGKSIHLGLLQIDHDKLATILNAFQGHVASRSDSHAGAHSNNQVGHPMQSETFVQDLFLEVLPKVNDRVLKLSTTAWSVANATSQMIFSASPSSIVSHMLSITLHTHLKIGVAMQLCQMFGFYATLTVQTINILTDNTFENSTVLQLNKRHVRRRGPRHLDSRIEGHFVRVRQGLASLFHLLFILLLEGGLLPAAWARFQYRAIARAIVWNTRGCRDTSAREHSHKLRIFDPFG